MMIDRRDFVAGTALVAVTPALRLLRPDVASPEWDVARPVFMISGWSAQTDSSPDDQVWLTVGHGWRTAWR
jgi:hypothetical protein